MVHPAGAAGRTTGGSRSARAHWQVHADACAVRCPVAGMTATLGDAARWRGIDDCPRRRRRWHRRSSRRSLHENALVAENGSTGAILSSVHAHPGSGDRSFYTDLLTQFSRECPGIAMRCRVHNPIFWRMVRRPRVAWRSSMLKVGNIYRLKFPGIAARVIEPPPGKAPKDYPFLMESLFLRSRWYMNARGEPHYPDSPRLVLAQQAVAPKRAPQKGQHRERSF